MSNMFGSNFDPYDALIELSEKLKRLEYAHNALARDYVKTQGDLQIALESLNSLQKGHLALSKIVTNSFDTTTNSKVPGKY